MKSMKSMMCGAATMLAAMAITVSANGQALNGSVAVAPIHGCGYVVVQQPPALGSWPMPQRDNSVEIVSLQNQLWRLRLELEDARANLKVAIAQGTGWVTANMRVMMIMRHISMCERRIMELMR